VQEVDAEIKLALQVDASADFNVLTKNHNLSILNVNDEFFLKNGYKNKPFGRKKQKKHEKNAWNFGYSKKRL
jgi:hypothetical protein